MTSTAILFGAHRITPRVLEGWQRLRRDLEESDYRLVFQYDNSRGDFDPAVFGPGEEVFLFTRDGLAAHYDMTSCAAEGRVYDGNTTFPLLRFAAANPGCDFLWRLEYDVTYEGNWRDFFDAFRDNPADLLATTLFRPPVRPEWKWWSTLKTPWHHWRRVDRVRAFLAVCRLSRTACETLDHAYAAGWRGHDEVSVPSILNAKGLAIEDLGGDGEFTAPGNRQRFYRNTPDAKWLAPGTLVCPPATPEPLGLPGMLYHPLK